MKIFIATIAALCATAVSATKINTVWSGQTDGTKYYLIQPRVECKSSDSWMGYYNTVGECAHAAEKKKGKYFVYGQINRKRYCYIEHTSSSGCKEGLKENKNYTFYGLGALKQPTAKSTMIKAAHECGSNGSYLGIYDTIEKCAGATEEKGRKYFIYGTGKHRKGKCYTQHTSSAACKEGFVKNKYNFYKVGAGTMRQERNFSSFYAWKGPDHFITKKIVTLDKGQDIKSFIDTLVLGGNHSCYKVMGYRPPTRLQIVRHGRVIATKGLGLCGTFLSSWNQPKFVAKMKGGDEIRLQIKVKHGDNYMHVLGDKIEVTGTPKTRSLNGIHAEEAAIAKKLADKMPKKQKKQDDSSSDSDSDSRS